MTLIRKIWECLRAFFCCCCQKEEKKISIPLTPEQKQSRLEKLESDLTQLAQSLKEKVNPKNIHYYKGQKNLGNSCYMNACLQSLEKAYIRKDASCKALINQDLSLGEGESLDALEKRLLGTWAPVITLEGDASPHEKILFKWSFLLLMQAKKHGRKLLQNQALRLHHRLCFTLGRREDFKQGPYEEKDAAVYLEFWHEMLGLQISLSTSREVPVEEKVFSSKKLETLSLLSINMPQKKQDFLTLIESTFIEHVKDNKDYTTELNGKKVTPPEFTIKMKIQDPIPQALFFHIKRFQVDQKGRGVKVGQSVPLGFDPKEPIDLSAYIESKKKQTPRYQLNSIISHQGDYEGGHYVAYVKNSQKEWVCLNDDSESPLPIEKVPFAKAYILGFNTIQEASLKKAPSDVPAN